MSHAVTLIAVQAEAGQATLDTDPAASRRSLTAIASVSRDALAELHALLGLLAEDEASGATEPAMTPGLGALPMLVAGVRATGVDVVLVEEGPRPSLEPDVDLCAYRVVQEGLTNALRHSRRPDVTIRIDSLPREVQIHVDSAGPVHRSSYGGGGRGLDGLRERVLALGGTFTSGQPTDDRFSVQVTLPQATGRPDDRVIR